MLDGLTALAHRYRWIWSIEDSYQTSPGKFILTVSDLHLVVPVSRWILPAQLLCVQAATLVWLIQGYVNFQTRWVRTDQVNPE